MKKSVFPILYLTVSILICISLAVGFLALGPAPAGANEVLSPTPELICADGQLNSQFLTDANRYYSDHFGFRQSCITLYAQLNALLFSRSTSEDVLLGKEGWLFFSRTVSDYSGSHPMAKSDLAALCGNLYLIQEFCEAHGAAFRFCCVPNKNTLYPRFMPDYPVSSGELHDLEKLQMLLEEAGIPYADLLNAFREQPEILYFAHDSHWNNKGAALAADCITASLGRPASYFSGNFSEKEDHKGDLYEMLFPAAEDPEENPVYGGTLAYEFGKKSGTRPDSITIRTVGSGDGNLLMYRDSFGNLLFPYLASEFGNAVFSRSADYDLGAVLYGETDTLIIEIVERNLPQLLNRIPTMPAPERQLPPTIPSGFVVLICDSADSLQGFRLWRGTHSYDADCPVYLLTQGKAYECFRMEDGQFAAWLPETETASGAALTLNGQTILLSNQT